MANGDAFYLIANYFNFFGKIFSLIEKMLTIIRIGSFIQFFSDVGHDFMFSFTGDLEKTRFLKIKIKMIFYYCF